MKTARFLLTFIGCGVLALRVSYADEPSKPPTDQIFRENHSTEPAQSKTEPTAGKISEPKDGSQASKKIVLTGPSKTDSKRKPGADIHKTDPKKKPGEDLHKTDLARKPVERTHQSDMKKPATAKDGIMTNKVGNSRNPLAKMPAGNESLASRAGVVRSRGATAALVGRVLIPSSTKYSAGPLDGASLQRTP
jgi:hypothetical protein